ncbi:MAG: hypothetical protein NTX57_00725 [Armatimonadetes bacterium]|nr:hypothetical protein [Armatimonadota bacterium]
MIGNTLTFPYQAIKKHAEVSGGYLPSQTEGQEFRANGIGPKLIYNPEVAGKPWNHLPRNQWILRTAEPLGENIWTIVRGHKDDERGELRWKARPNLNLWLFWNAGGFTAMLTLVLGGLALLEWRLKRNLAR